MKRKAVAEFLERTRREWLAGRLSQISGDYEIEARNGFLVGGQIDNSYFVETINSISPDQKEWLIGCAECGNLNCILTNEKLFLRKTQAHRHDVFKLVDISQYKNSRWWSGTVVLILRNGTKHTSRGLEWFPTQAAVRFAIGYALCRAYIKEVQEKAQETRDQEFREQWSKQQNKPETEQSESNSRDGSDMSDLEREYGKLLGFSGRVVREEIKVKYRQAISKCHPDKVHGLHDEIREVAERRTKMINEAYDYFCKKLGL